MSGYRITKLICPSCRGTGDFRVMADRGLRCLWCGGSGRATVRRATQWADRVFALAGGGYVCGDHSLETARTMEAEAERVYALAELTPPWKAVAA